MSGCPFHALFGLRKDLPVGIPDRIRNLPVDERGYPVPWFVDWIDGKPEFRAMDGRKFDRCINEKLCWVCGERLKKHVAFVIGPMCTITRTSAEPPSHLDCAEWSVKACPFLSKPQMKRREDDLINNENTHGRVAGVADPATGQVVEVRLTKEQQIRMCGNSVCPQVEAALVRANVPELAIRFGDEMKGLVAA